MRNLKSIEAAVMLLALSLGLAVSVHGCKSLEQDPNAELVAATELYRATGKILIGLKAQGMLGDDEIKDVSAALHLGKKYLYQWKSQVEAGRTDPEVKAAFALVMRELTRVQSNHASN